MSGIRQLLLHQRAVADKEMQKAMDEAAAPFRAQMHEIDAALAAINAVRAGTAAAVPPDEAQPKEADASASPRQTTRRATREIGLTLKEMILLTLRTRHKGADALTILDEINARWKIGLERTSLSPQLSRLKNEGKLHLIGKVWTLAQQDETPDAETAGVSLVGVAGSPAVPKSVSPTGSTPVASTTPLFPPSEERKEEP